MCGCCSRVRMCPPREVSRLPFLDTDIARGLFLLTIDDFFFFCNEFGIDAFRPACAMEGSSVDQYYVFDASTRFVGIQFLELGGDHLDRLMTFATHQHDVTAVINRPLSDPSPGDTSFSSHLQDVLERSMDLLKTSRRTLYFINCQTLFDRSPHTGVLTLSHTAFMRLLERLAFLASQLAHRDERHGVLFCCSMVWEGKVDGEASIKVVREACEGRAGSAAAIDSLWSSLPGYGPSWEAPPDEGEVTTEPFAEDVGSISHDGIDRLRRNPQFHFLQWVFHCVLWRQPSFPWTTSLNFLSLTIARALEDPPPAPSQPQQQPQPPPSRGLPAPLCVPSVVMTVARLLKAKAMRTEGPQTLQQQQEGAGDVAGGLPPVGELGALLLHTVVNSVMWHRDAGGGRVALWVTRRDFHDFLDQAGEDDEMETAAMSELPPMTMLNWWDKTVGALAQIGLMAHHGGRGYPRIAVRLSADPSRAVVIAPQTAPDAGDPDSAVAFPYYPALLQAFTSSLLTIPSLPPDFWTQHASAQPVLATLRGRAMGDEALNGLREEIGRVVERAVTDEGMLGGGIHLLMFLAHDWHQVAMLREPSGVIALLRVPLSAAAHSAWRAVVRDVLVEGSQAAAALHQEGLHAQAGVGEGDGDICVVSLELCGSGSTRTELH